MPKQWEFLKYLGLFLLPVAFTVVGLLRADGVGWANTLTQLLIGLFLTYLLVWAPSTIVYGVIYIALPLGMIGIVFLSVYLLNHHWLLSLISLLLLRAFWPILNADSYRSLCLDFRQRMNRENQWLVNILKRF